MSTSNDCPTPRADPVARPEWQPGSRFTAAACVTEQTYRLQRLRRHNRNMHGWGVLCGLWVAPGADGAHPWSVKICPGYAIGPYGDEIEVPNATAVNIEDYLWFRPQTFATVALPSIAYIVVRYQEWLDGMVPLPGAPCDCADPEYGASRIGDGYQAGVVWTSPVSIVVPGICDAESQPCPPCPSSPWVTLARVTLPAQGVGITAAMIDNGIRSTL